MIPVPARDLVENQTGMAQHVQVLGNRGPAQRELRTQGTRWPRSVRQDQQQSWAYRGQCDEHIACPHDDNDMSELSDVSPLRRRDTWAPQRFIGWALRHAGSRSSCQLRGAKAASPCNGEMVFESQHGADRYHEYGVDFNEHQPTMRTAAYNLAGTSHR